MNADDKRANIPEDCDRLFAACVESRDLDSLIGFYEPNPSLVRRDHTVAAGHAEIRQVLQRLVTERTELCMSIVRIVASGDLAMLYNDWVMRMLGADGHVTSAEGRAIEIVRRQPDGRWLFAIDDPFARG